MAHFVERSTKEATLRKEPHMDKRFVFDVLVFYRVDMKNILRLIYENVTVLEPWKYKHIGKVVPRTRDVYRWDLGTPKSLVGIRDAQSGTRDPEPQNIQVEPGIQDPQN